MNRQNLAVGLVLLASVLLVYAVNRVTTKQPSISLDSCQPRDAWARLSRAYDPRAFWIEQNITLEDLYTQENLRDVLDDCEIQNKSSQVEREQCIAHYRDLWQRGTRCLVS